MYEPQIAVFMHNYRTKNCLVHLTTVSIKTVISINIDWPDFLKIARCESKSSKNLPLYQFPRISNKWIRRIPNSNLRTSFKIVKKFNLFEVYSHEVRCNYSDYKENMQPPLIYSRNLARNQFQFTNLKSSSCFKYIYIYIYIYIYVCARACVYVCVCVCDRTCLNFCCWQIYWKLVFIACT